VIVPMNPIALLPVISLNSQPVRSMTRDGFRQSIEATLTCRLSTPPTQLTDANSQNVVRAVLRRVSRLSGPSRRRYLRLPPPQLGFAGFNGHAHPLTSVVLAEPPPLNTP
jgi:hypothetical protein